MYLQSGHDLVTANFVKKICVTNKLITHFNFVFYLFFFLICYGFIPFFLKSFPRPCLLNSQINVLFDLDLLHVLIITNPKWGRTRFMYISKISLAPFLPTILPTILLTTT